MTGIAKVLRSGICKDTGYPVQEIERGHTFPWQQPTFWVCRAHPEQRINIGTGDTKEEAVAAMLRKNPALQIRKAA